MPKFETNQIDVKGDGRIILYQRPDVKNPKWQCRISVSGSTGYKIFSTKETDQRLAERIALDRYEELYFKVRSGGFLKGRPFNVVAKEWIETFGTEPGEYDKQLIRRVELLALPFFKSKSIDEITDGDLFEMMDSLNGREQLQTSTIRHYRTSVAKVFDYAKIKGYIQNKPNIPAPSLVRNPRPDFTETDWKILTEHMRSWVSETTQGERGKNGLDHKRHRERFYLQHYILIMGNTGIRIGEMRNVRWVDLASGVGEDGEERVLISVDGKTGRRTVVSNFGVERYLKRLWEFRATEVGTEPDLREFIFCHPDGRRVGSYKKGFENLLAECKLRTDNEGRNRTLYSLRHTYATMRINRVPVYQLAVNMGTSVEMIEQYYSHARTADPAFVSTMTQGNQKGTGRALPF
jgi:integrase